MESNGNYTVIAYNWNILCPECEDGIMIMGADNLGPVYGSYLNTNRCSKCGYEIDFSMIRKGEQIP